jgi:hypothetical protein
MIDQWVGLDQWVRIDQWFTTEHCVEFDRWFGYTIGI